MLRKLIVFLATVVVLAATHARALGLGDITLESSLNQPLSARIELLQTSGVRVEDIRVEMAGTGDFERFSLDRPYFLDSIRFHVRGAGPDNENPYIELSSTRPVREPYLSFVLDTRWPRGRVLTEYTVLVDPPSFASAGLTQDPQPPVSTRVEQGPAETVESGSAVEPAAEPVTTGQSAGPASGSDGSTGRFADTERTVPVEGDDTLWDIALQVRPDDTFSVQQTMLALRRLNPDAFINGNINLVRRGAVLRVPDADSIRDLNTSEAISEVDRQNRLFQDRRDVPAGSEPLASPPDSDGAQSPGEGELSVVSVDQDPQGESQSASADAAAGEQFRELDDRIEALENELAVSREEMDRVERENRELDERLSMLEEQIESAREVIRLRDLELAQLQESLSGGEAGQQPAGDGENAGQPAPPTVTMAPDAPLPERIINSLLNNPVALGAILALVVALLVLLLIRRNRAKQAELADEQHEQDEDEELDFSRVGTAAAVGEEPAADEEAPDNDVSFDESTDHGRENETPDNERMGREGFEQYEDDDDLVNELRSFNEQGESALFSEDLDELLAEVDALTEHHQYDEARKLLEDALVAEPNHQELRMRLLEVLAAQGDVGKFRLQESGLGELDSDALQERLESLRKQVASLESARLDETDGSGMENFLEFSDIKDEDDIGLELDTESGTEVDDGKVQYDEPATEAGGIDELTGGKDGRQVEDAPDDFSQGPDSETEAETPGDENEYEFEFEFDPDAEPDRDREGHRNPGNESEAAGKDEEFDFSLDDFALDAESGTGSEPDPETESARESSAYEPGSEGSLADLGFTDNRGGAFDEADGEDESGFLSDTDEAATKLDLARAYIDMGDGEGAREILEEVIREGTGEQVADARKLIERLD